MSTERGGQQGQPVDDQARSPFEQDRVLGAERFTLHRVPDDDRLVPRHGAQLAGGREPGPTATGESSFLDEGDQLVGVQVGER
jgi:hypothetical protein